MTGRYALGALDEQLERLLELPMDERQARLVDLDRTQPELAVVLRKLLRITVEVETQELRRSGEQLLRQVDEAPPPVIPGYVIEGEIGRGGMATVWAASREVAGVVQPVAIKVLRSSLSSPVDQARFVNEQRILARLRHPHIATLLDVGVIDDRPHMVMERIDGAPIDQRLPAASADLGRVLDALDAVADALVAAHAHLVIHRDIKPGNVLVDAEGHVKLIDFGVAKLLDDAPGLRPERTATTGVPLTLRYASPEQLGSQPVGVASDIYQFGLLAYRLLTRSWPWSDGENDWPQARLDPLIEPVPPSRRVDNPALRRRLAGDLDAIVLKCLRRSPRERYGSMTELRDDLARHRSHRPVLARRQTWRYLTSGFVRRHRVGVALAAGVLALLLAGLYSSAMLAARNAQHAERIARVLETFTMLLTEADPYEGSPGTVTVGQVVDAASERLLAERSGDPDFDLALLERLAALQADLRNPAQQLSLLAEARERAAGTADGEVARQRIAAAEIAALGRLGRYDEAERALADYRRHWPEPLPLRLALNEARLHLDRGDFDQAAQLLDALLPRVPADARLLRYDILAERGYLLSRRGRYQDALAVFEQAGTLLDPGDLAQRRIALRHRANYANALGLAGRQAEAATLFAGLRDEYAARLGADHPRVVQLTINIAQMLTLSARPQQALSEVQGVDLKAIARHDARLAAMAGVQRGRAALYAGSLAQVMPSYLDALEISIAAIGPDAPGLAPFLEPLAFALFAFGEDALAVAVAQRARALDPEVTVGSDLLLEWLGERMRVTGRPDPGFAGRLKSDCDRVEYEVVRAYLAGRLDGELPSAVPADCGTPSALLLEGLGLVWEAPAGIPAERTIALPLVARLSGQPLPEAARLTEEDRVRITAWLAPGER